MCCVDEYEGLKHHQYEKHRFATFYDDSYGGGGGVGGGFNNTLVQKCFVFLEGRQRGKWTNKRKISLNHCFKSLFRFNLDLKVRLIEAFPVKAELHNVVGYVYRFKRAAGGYAQFLNSTVFQLVHKWHQSFRAFADADKSIFLEFELRVGKCQISEP